MSAPSANAPAISHRRRARTSRRSRRAPRPIARSRAPMARLRTATSGRSPAGPIQKRASGPGATIATAPRAVRPAAIHPAADRAERAIMDKLQG